MAFGSCPCLKSFEIVELNPGLLQRAVPFGEESTRSSEAGGFTGRISQLRIVKQRQATQTPPETQSCEPPSFTELVSGKSLTPTQLTRRLARDSGCGYLTAGAEILNCPLHGETVITVWSTWLPCGCIQKPRERYLRWGGGFTTEAQEEGQRFKEQLARRY